MKDNLQLIKCLSDEEWDQFIKNSPQNNPFSSSQFLKALDIDFCKYFVLVNNKIEASILILKPDDQSFSAPYTYTLYQGLTYSKPNSNGPSQISFNLKTTQSILNHINLIHPTNSLCLHYSISDLRAFQWYNYNEKEKNKYSFELIYTGIIHICEHESFKSYLSTIRSSRRQDHKKSQKAGFTICRKSLIPDFIRLYQLTFARQDVEIPPSEIQYIENLVTSLIQCGLAKMLSAVDKEGHIRSSIVIISDSQCDYYLFAASDPGFRSYGLNTFLLLESIKESFAQKKKYFDMVGINSPNRGDFKTSFNAIPTPFFSVKIKNSRVNSEIISD